MTPDDARDWLFGPRADTQPPLRQDVLDAICDADDTRPPDGIDRPTWGQMTPNDRMEVARFASFLRAVGPYPTGEAQ